MRCRSQDQWRTVSVWCMKWFLSDYLIEMGDILKKNAFVSILFEWFGWRFIVVSVFFAHQRSGSGVSTWKVAVKDPNVHQSRIRCPHSFLCVWKQNASCVGADNPEAAEVKFFPFYSPSVERLIWNWSKIVLFATAVTCKASKLNV